MTGQAVRAGQSGWKQFWGGLGGVANLANIAVIAVGLVLVWFVRGRVSRESAPEPAPSA